jgi:hypothetical protein
VLILFSGLRAARPDLRRVYAHVHGGCRNNLVAGAIARKALFFALEADDLYASPVKNREVLANSRGVPIDTARMFRDHDLADLARLDERDVERLFRADGLGDRDAAEDDGID